MGTAIVLFVVVFCLAGLGVWWDMSRRDHVFDPMLRPRRLLEGGPRSVDADNNNEAYRKLQSLDLSVCANCRKYIRLTECIIDYSPKHGRMTDHYLLHCGCDEPWVVVYPDLHGPMQPTEEQYE